MLVGETVGERVRRLRLKHALTMTALAHAVGVSEAAIRQIEAGPTKLPGALTTLGLAEALSVTPRYLLTGHDRPAAGRPPAGDWTEAVEGLIARLAALEARVSALEGPAQRSRSART
jgi:transcriptional regulator with XRE-family HTH domain